MDINYLFDVLICLVLSCLDTCICSWKVEVGIPPESFTSEILGRALFLHLESTVFRGLGALTLRAEQAFLAAASSISVAIGVFWSHILRKP